MDVCSVPDEPSATLPSLFLPVNFNKIYYITFSQRRTSYTPAQMTKNPPVVTGGFMYTVIQLSNVCRPSVLR